MSLLNSLRRLTSRKTARRSVDGSSESDAANSKSFSGDLALFNSKFLSGEPFSLVRFGDGEMKIIQGEAIDLSSKYNGEHKYVPGQAVDEQQRVRLTESLKFQDTRYFVGIACPCCVGIDNFMDLKKASGQPESQLTWANIFVNANYHPFLEQTTPLFTNRKIAMVCHERADLNGLPFTVEKRFSTGGNSWINDHQRVYQELHDTFSSLEQGDKDSWVVLFCAGVLSNILVKEMTIRHPGHTYIDLGSVYDSKMNLGKTRKYLKGSKNLKKVCVWA
ncbi:MAG: hypothetical protein AB8B64_12480 [Granulosicoccus sp.]